MQRLAWLVWWMRYAYATLHFNAPVGWGKARGHEHRTPTRLCNSPHQKPNQKTPDIVVAPQRQITPAANLTYASGLCFVGWVSFECNEKRNPTCPYKITLPKRNQTRPYLNFKLFNKPLKLSANFFQRFA